MRWPPRRARAALIGSLLLHAALAVWLATRPPEAPAPRTPEAPLTIEIVEPKPAPHAPAVATAPLPAIAPKASRTRAAPKVVPHAAPAPSTPPAAPPQVAASGPDVPRAPAADVPRAPDLGNAALKSADRVVTSHLALEPPKLAPKEDRSIHAPFVIDDPNARLSAMINEGVGRSKVERGLVDPYFHELGAAMATQWKPEKKVDEKGLSGFLDEAGRGARQAVSDYTRAWLAAAEQYGKGGGLDADGVLDADGRLRENLPPGVTQATPSQLRSTRIALVRLTQRLDGHLLDVELVQPSIDPEMDREVLRELRVGEMVLPVPPQSGQGIHNPVRSVWAFELTVSISPPAPMVAGSFDIEWFFDKKMREEMGNFVDVRMPLSRRITKRVDLVSVE